MQVTVVNRCSALLLTSTHLALLAAYGFSKDCRLRCAIGFLRYGPAKPADTAGANQETMTGDKQLLQAAQTECFRRH